MNEIGTLLASAAPGVKVTVGVKSKLRDTARKQLTTLDVPPPVMKMLEASLDVEVAKRPRDAKEMVGEKISERNDFRTEFGKWCDELVGDIEVCVRARGSLVCTA